jgi:hypothetical protein
MKAHTVAMGKSASPCAEYKWLKLGYESTLRGCNLYGFKGAASILQTIRYEYDAKAIAANAGDLLSGHSQTCQVCQENRRP